MNLSIGSLAAVPALTRPDLLAAPVAGALAALDEATSSAVGVAEIDPAATDTAAFCERYGVSPEESANCVVIGSGVRRSKLVLAGKLLASLPGVRVIDGLAR